ncbi:hypothetical protein CBS9595_002791 [Malassezia furfur]|nr:hypothetical protein CBS9595_002791 [Malassezia furfur]
MAEFPSASGSDDVASLSLDEKLVSKARLAGYEELARLFSRTASEDDPVFAEYARRSETLRAMALDANAAAQEKGLEALVAFVQNGGRVAGRTREAVLPAIAEKGLPSMRTGTRKHAHDLVLLYAAHEDAAGCDGLLADLCALLSSKQPKVVAANVAALSALVSAFGTQQLQVKGVVKRVPDVFAHADKNVRAEGTQLAVALHRYLGPALRPTLGQLKEIQVKELEAKFAEADAQGVPCPTHYLLSQQPAPAPAAEEAEEATEAPAAGAAAPAAAPEAPAVDAYDLAEPHDALHSRKLVGDFFERVASTKWQERMEALESLHAALTESVRLAPDTGYEAYVQAIQVRLQKDVNINVVVQAYKCLEALADGLRHDAQRYLYILPVVLEKLKERKPAVADVVASTLDALFRAGRWSDVLEPLEGVAAHKNPAVKAGAMRFLTRCLQTTATPPSGAEVKTCAKLLTDALGDGSGDVRDPAATGFGTLLKLVGERPMLAYLDALDDIKKSKVRDEASRATVRASGKAAPAPPAAVPAAAPAAAPKPAAPKPAAPRAPRPPAAAARAAPGPPSGHASPARPVARAPAAPRAPASPARAPVRSGGRPAPSAPRAAAAPSGARPAAAPARGGKAAPGDDRVKFQYTPEDAEARFDEAVPANMRELLAHASWKERLQGAQELGAYVRATPVDAELLARFLGKYPGWKESNFQVLNEVYRVLQCVAQDEAASVSFDRAAAALTIPSLCDKLGDLKLKGNASDTLYVYAEAVSPGFVVARALPALGALKAPKAQAEAVQWLEQLLLAFGTRGVPIADVVAYLLGALKSANAAVRANATKAIGTLARFVGTPLQAMLGDDLNAQLRSSLEAEIAAHAGDAPAPTRFVRTRGGEASAPAAEAPAAPTPAAPRDADAIDEDEQERLVPRVDVETLVPSASLAQLGDASWKVRKEALEGVQAALAPHPRLKGAAGELCAALKARYADNNLQVRTLALDIAAKLANGLHAQFEPYVRTLVPPITQVLADSKAPLRAAAASALTAIEAQVGLPPMVAAMAPVLDGKGANPMLRQDAFTWLGERMAAQLPADLDVVPLLPSVLQSLDDRTPGVRKASQTLLPYLVARGGYKVVIEHCDALRSASRATAVPLVDAARPAAAALGGGPTAVNRALRAPDATPSARRLGETPAAPAAGDVCPLLAADGRAKAQREKAAARQPPFLSVDGAVRGEQVEQVRHAMDACCAPGLVHALFSTDHNAERDWLAGLGTLQTYLVTPPPPDDERDLRVVASSDVLLRYVCVRLLDKNTSVALKCFEVLHALLAVLTTHAYALSDAEAHVLLPALLQRLGDPKAAFREQVRDLVRRTALLFPPSRIVPLLLEHGAGSKNARARAEALGEVEHLLAQHGLAVCTPGKTLPAVAQLIADRDAGVRNAALQTLAEAYKTTGDALWRQIGTLAPKDASLLEERLRRTAAPAPAPAPPVTPGRTPRRATPPTPAEPTTPSALPRAPRMPRASLATPGARPARDAEVDARLATELSRVASADVEESTVALKAAQEQLRGQRPLPGAALDAGVACVVAALQSPPSGTEAQTQRHTKHVLQTALVLLDAQDAAAKRPVLDEGAFTALVTALLTRLMDASASQDAEAQTLAKHLNAVVLRALATSDANVVYASCFGLLVRLTKEMDAERDDDAERTARLAELVIKCLWKAARKLPDALRAHQVQGAQLLATIEDVLQAIPPIEWGRRVQRQAPLKDIPLITATNVLKQLIDTVGEEALTMLDTLPDPEGSHVYRYLLRLLYVDEGAKADAPTPPAADTARAASPAPASPPAAPEEDVVTLELRGIFDRISQKDQSRAAIRELYEFQKRHPAKQGDIDRSLQNTGPIFQRYIKRALANHAAEDAPRTARASSAAPRRPTAPPSSHGAASDAGAAMDARLAELKAKFRKESEAPAPSATERTQKRMSMSTEALRQRLASLRPE